MTIHQGFDDEKTSVALLSARTKCLRSLHARKEETVVAAAAAAEATDLRSRENSSRGL